MEENKRELIVKEIIDVLRKHNLTIGETDAVLYELTNRYLEESKKQKF